MLNFENFGSELVYSIDIAARLCLFVSFSLPCMVFRMKTIQSGYAFVLLNEFILGVWNKKFDKWDTFSIRYGKCIPFFI